MIVHIVMFEFKDENKNENINKAKKLLESLKGKIDILNKIEVGINFDTASRALDLSLYTTFDTKEDLNIYTNHSEHLKVVAFIKEVTSMSKVVDYII